MVPWSQKLRLEYIPAVNPAADTASEKPFHTHRSSWAVQHSELDRTPGLQSP